MELKCVMLPAENFSAQINFYIQKLGYQLLNDTPSSNDNEGVMLERQGCLINFIPSKEAKTDLTGSIIMDTDDCLMDYYILREKGVKFKTEPEYTPDGLAASFFDPSGNEWILLEKREYKDI